MSYRQLNVEERTLIARFLSQGCTCREIGRRLGRSHSTMTLPRFDVHHVTQPRGWIQT
jgi:IS30 family transposase